jgi:DNA ligase-1
VRLSELVEASEKVAATSRRLEKVDVLARLLRRLEAAETGVAVSYLCGGPPQGKLGIAYRSLQAAMQIETTADPSLGLLEVDRRLEAIAAAPARSVKLGLLQDLMGVSSGAERRFLAALLTGELRQGALEGLMVDAVAKAALIPPERVRRAAMMAGGIAPVAGAVLARGADALEQFRVKLFQPVQPMLAQTAETAADAIAELGDAALEFKLDGARIQVHKSGADVVVYSRGQNNVTAAVPEVVTLVRALPARELIIDGEVLCMTGEGRPEPFQVTMRRFGRKLDVERVRAELPLTPFWFDLLFADGGPLLDEPQSRRFAELGRIVPPEQSVPHLATADALRAQEFFERALELGHEGIMAKSTVAGYEAGARGMNWLKIKQARTLDLVVLAAEWGSGRRKGWLSNIHLGARDPATGAFPMLGKTFKGLTDAMLEWQTAEFQKIAIGRDDYTVYLEPKIVAEVAFNEIQASPVYPSGMALRFARVKRYRTDKTAAEADTVDTVRRHFADGKPEAPEPV